MKKIILISVSFVTVFMSCQKESDSSVGSSGQDVWAEQIEANSSLVRPEGWADEDWKAVNKNVDHQKIYNTIVDAVISGKQKAYDFITDSAYTADEAKIRLENIKAENISAIRTREEWHFDKEKFKLEKQVTRICLFTEKLDESGEYVGDKVLFYVKLNN